MLILRFIWNCKEPRIAKTILKRKEKVRVTLFDFKTYSKTTMTKTDWGTHVRIDNGTE